jgi:hypothetical protein
MINNIDRIIKRETLKAISSILESNLGNPSEEQERERQRQQSKETSARGVTSSDSSSKKTDEAEDADEEKQAKTADDEKREDRTGGKGTADSPKMKTPDLKQLKKPTVVNVIDKLNALRGGKSLKEPEVRKSFGQYFDSLNTAERQSLLLFVTGIAQILSGVETGAEAVDPGDAGLSLKGDVTSAKSDQRPEEKDKSREGTTDNPIVVGETANKSRILRALTEYRKHT